MLNRRVDAFESDEVSSERESHLSVVAHPTPPMSNISTRLTDDSDWEDDMGDLVPASAARSPNEQASLVTEGEGDAGILILSGSEQEEASERSTTPSNSNIPLALVYQTATDLSLPGTDSLPTEIDSLDGTFNQETPTNASVKSRNENKGSQTAPGDTQQKAILVTSLATSVIMFLVIIYLAWERSSWRSMALRLELDLKDVSQQLDEAQNRSASILSLLAPVASPSNDQEWYEGDFDWETEDFMSARNVVIANNCWLKAKASISLGNCASNAKESFSESFTDISSGVKNAFEHVGKSIWNLKEQSADTLFHGPDSLLHGPLQTAGVATLDGITDVTHAIASATVAASDVMRTAVHKAGNFVDHSIICAVEEVRDAIQDATDPLRKME